MTNEDDDKRWKGRLKRVAKAKDLPSAAKPDLIRKKPEKSPKQKDVGDETPNPLPDDDGSDGGGDPGRSG